MDVNGTGYLADIESRRMEARWKSHRVGDVIVL